MIEKQVKRTIGEHGLLQPGQHVVIGLSGGPDSVCLFFLLKKMGYRLHPVHVNHQIRPGDADRDQKYVEDLARAQGLACRVVSFDCMKAARDQGITTEEAGRNMRYQSFRKEAESLLASGIPGEQIAIAVAHNAEDQVETVLFRLLRGTGPDGLAGMDYKRMDPSGVPIVRPLLDVSREEILRFCREQELSPCMDHTNEVPVYARNRIRLELIPALAEYNPSVKEAVLRLSRIAAEDKAFLAGLAENWLASHMEEADGNLILPAAELSELADAVRHRVYALALEQVGLSEDLAYSHMKAMDGILCSPNPSARVDLPRGTSARRQYDKLVLSGDKNAPEEGDGPRIMVRRIPAEEYTQELRKTGAAFDEERLKEHFGEGAGEKILLRSRQAGDFLPIPGGRKKLQDLLVDQKIPRDLRDGIYFAAVGNEILYLPAQKGIEKPRYNPQFFVTETTKNVIYIEIIG